MNKGLLLVIAIVIITLGGCENRSNNKDQSNTPKANKGDVQKKYTLQDEPAKTVMNCIFWYHKNDSLLNKMWCAVANPNPCGPASMGDPVNDSLAMNTYYAMDFGATEKLLAQLKQSNYYSDIFLNQLRRYFERVEAGWKKEPKNIMAAPEDFEFDFMSFSQMFQWDSRAILETKVIELQQSKDKGMVTLKFAAPGNELISYFLSKKTSGWQIDSIESRQYIY